MGKTVSQSISSKKDRIVFLLSLYLDPMADTTAKFEVFSVVQHKKKTGSQQKQKREAKSNNIDCHL